MRTSMKIVVALAAFALAATAHAAGLGRLTVLSALGQPLLAEIEIVALQPGEDEGLSARLPSLETFAAAGVDVNPALSGLRISLERRDKRPFLRLTTAQPINEPFLEPDEYPRGRTDRPRASRCERIPPHRRRALDDAPATLATLPAPGANR